MQINTRLPKGNEVVAAKLVQIMDLRGSTGRPFTQETMPISVFVAMNGLHRGPWFAGNPLL
jgi:hypothetical protein